VELPSSQSQTLQNKKPRLASPALIFAMIAKRAASLQTNSQLLSGGYGTRTDGKAIK